MIRVPGSDDVIVSAQTGVGAGADRIWRWLPDGSTLWDKFAGDDTGVSGFIASGSSQQVAISDGRFYYRVSNPSGGFGTGDHVCSRRVSDGGDFQAHIRITDFNHTANMTIVCFREDRAGDWWVQLRGAGVDTGNMLRFDSDWNLVYNWFDLDPTNAVFTDTSAFKFREFHLMANQNRMVFLQDGGITQLRIRAIDLT